jgi:hypothetical protein
MYKLNNGLFSDIPCSVTRLSDGACIPFNEANTDYQQFKSDIANGAELQDAEGKVMTKEQVQTFLGGLK